MNGISGKQIEETPRGALEIVPILGFERHFDSVLGDA
jgi:hypothetical protein